MNNFENFIKNLGTLGEASLVLYRAVREAGGSKDEARQVTAAYIVANMSFGQPSQ